MRTLLPALVLISSSAAAADLVPADRASFHIFVLMGQSNMAGSALPILEDYREPSARVLTQSPDLSWKGARTPLGGNPGGGMSPGESFARHYAELHPGVTVGLIQCARGGRGIKELAKGGKDRDGAPNYDNGMKRILAAAKQGVVKGVLWHQGETDAGDQEYVKKLGALAGDLRADIGDAQLPLICGELGRFAGWTSGFNARIPAAAKDIPRCAVAPSEGLLDLGDKVHFSSFSCEVQGARYLMQYLQMAEPDLAPRFKPTLEDVTARMLAREAAWKGVLNGDMGEGAKRPLGWDTSWVGKGSLEVARDTEVKVSAPASLRLASAGGAVQASVSQPLRGTAGSLVTVTAQVRNAGFASLQFVLTGIDGSWKKALDKVAVDGATAKEWTAVSGTAAVPAGVHNVRLGIAVTGEGTAWIDDVAVALSEAPAAAPAAAPAGGNLLTNPGMTEGDAVPAGWTATWAGKGKVASVRDTQVSKTGPASLRVESVGGAAKGSVSQALQGVAGRQLRITGWVKGDGAAVASVGLGSFSGDWKMLAWETLLVIPAGGNQEWTSFDKTVTVPAGAEHVNLGAGIDGDGKAWFDDFAVSAPVP